jgi:hypothetical protein
VEIYPSIDTQIIDTNIYAFDKLDGSNIRAEWNRKNGFYKFGTRRRLMDENEPTLGEAVSLVCEQEDTLTDIFRKQRYEKVTAFFEFYGENSFAGQHVEEKHVVSLLDAHIFKKGYLLPTEFVKLFEDKVLTPEVLYSGKANQPFVQQVRESSLEGMTFEGVVCRGTELIRNRHPRFKVKSKAWLAKLKTYCGDDEQLFKNLA